MVAPHPGPGTAAGTEGHLGAVRVEIGQRVVVLSNLLLAPDPTEATRWATTEIVRLLEQWQGPGMVVVAGGLLGAVPDPSALRATLSDHEALANAVRHYTHDPGRRFEVVPGASDAALLADPDARAVLGGLGVTISDPFDLELDTGAGPKLVRIDAGTPPGARPGGGSVAGDPGLAGATAWWPRHVPRWWGGEPPAEGAADGAPGSGADGGPDATRNWQHGIDRLAEPSALHRFVTSRLLYRRMARHTWWLLIPFVVVALLRLPLLTVWLGHLFSAHPTAHRAIERARFASWGTRLLAAGIIGALGAAVMVVVLGVLSRKTWAALGGGALPGPFDNALGAAGGTANDASRLAAADLAQRGYAGVVSGATLQAELTHLGDGFFACPGTAGAVVEEHPGRLGLPPVFLEHRQLAWIELETGAGLHARLLLARFDPSPATVLERLAGRYRITRDRYPVVVAAHPQGTSWPPAPDLAGLRRRSRRVRRWAAAAIALAGVMDLVSSLSPPLRGRLHLVLQYLPLEVSQAAGALVTLAGIGLLALARGVRRGQQRAWAIASGVLATTLVLHLVRGGDVEESLLSGAVLGILLLYRSEFRARSDRPSLRSAATLLVAVVVGIALAATVVVFTLLRLRHRVPAAFPSLSIWRCGEAMVERMVGIRVVPLPDRLDDFLWPSMLTVGITAAALGALLVTRPVVDRHHSAGRLAELRARGIVGRHGEGTLDYFALRSDKRWFFHHDSLVAYAIYGGTCLVSPDPIGPAADRAKVWSAFRRFADNEGWTVAVMGAGESWLPYYHASGMHDVYIGDEAVVDVQSFSLAGGHMKGLRQAHNRIAKYGYRVSFHDPAHLDRETALRLTGLMSQSRRGEFERGFSMMLGRIFDPRDEGLLLCVVTGPDDTPAAMCQFVPSPGIAGYSLDLMRRDRGEHPNGLIDFALCSTIEELRARGASGLSLNFAALRSVLEGERGDGMLQRVERWAVSKMSSFFQIETLWRFNAKYDPNWLPRYVVYDSAEHLVPTVLAILRAESLWEVPVLGRVIAASDRRAQSAHDGHDGGGSQGTDGSGASLLPTLSQPDRGDRHDGDDRPGAGAEHGTALPADAVVGSEPEITAPD